MSANIVDEDLRGIVIAMLSTNNLPSNQQIEAGGDHGGNVVFKPSTSAASNNTNNAKNTNAKAKGGSLVNVTICFLDESKTVLQVSVSCFRAVVCSKVLLSITLC